MSEIEKLPQLAKIWQQTLQWQPDEAQQEQLQLLYEEILAGNRQLNLTRITAPMEFWEKHLWDSLAGLLGVEKEKLEPTQVIDIGTGAGFPGIPVAIAYPHWTVTLLDATRKKITFLETLLSTLKLNNLKTLTGRAEELGRQKLYRETYNIALVRAVGAASVCAEYALPLLKTDGLAILYRGNWSKEEDILLQQALAKLGGKFEEIKSFTTPITQSIRHCIYLRKISSKMARFPRTDL